MWLLKPLFIFCLKLVEALVQALSRQPGSKPPHTRPHSPEQQVFYLEWVRFTKGYKKGWLYYRCLEMGLVHVLEQLEATGALEKYRHELQKTGG